jgi:hypothetical protein
MKYYLFIFFITFSFLSCKQDNKTTSEEKQLTISEKIANAHGYQNWKNVKTFQFTFGGKIEDSSSGRTWNWNPKTNDVKLDRNGKTTEYNRNNMDSIALKADRAFINDKFWTLIPFQLIWDEGTTISEPIKQASPISKKQLNKITLTYSNDGGYTPGDAYDIYYDNVYIIREWSYRKGNADKPSLSNTFENYRDINGLKIAEHHKIFGSDRNLLIRNIKVELEK